MKEMNAKLSILELFAEDVIDAPETVTGGRRARSRSNSRSRRPRPCPRGPRGRRCRILRRRAALRRSRT